MSGTSRTHFQLVDAPGTVPDPVPGELLREPIADADVSCERCGARAWVRVERRAEPEEPFTRWSAIACAACGASVGWTSAGRERPGVRRDDQEPFGLPPGVREDHTLDDLVAAARFPVAAEGVTVTSSLPGAGPEVHGPEVAARLRLAELVDEQPEVGGLSEDAAQLVRRDAHRRAREAAEAAPVAPRPLTVDGARVEFLLIAAGDRWAACAALPDVAIEVTARRVRPEDVALTRR